MLTTIADIQYKTNFEILDQFSRRVRTARKNKGMTQADLGKRLGVSGRMVGEWERANRMANFEQLHNICAVLDVSIHYLIE